MNPEDENIDPELNNDFNSPEARIKPVSGLYKDWFLDYASYVILERAVPAIDDGLKPVQRRILHALNVMDDGRFNKVANVIGATMQYHPHGDAAIGDALVNLGQKDILFDTQGNWGDIRTGDKAAAPRYIEVRLSKLAKDIAFNDQTTEWQLSYDGRKNEPVTLSVKFPLLLAQGVEGIAVGLSTKIMPHNFVELIKASIQILKGKKTNILPDFPTGGMADFSNYNEGMKGSKVKVRARMEEVDKKTIAIKEIPYGTTTDSLIDSILKANDQGKIKIKKVVDNTAKDVFIEISLQPNTSVDKTIDALYAFTNCEMSISPAACVIMDEKPHFLSVNEILRESNQNTVHLLKRELQIKLHALQEKWHFSSLEKIFIEEKIYRDIEEAETWEQIISFIDKGLEPFKKNLLREVTEDDITRLTEIRIKRISKFDSFKADEIIKGLEESIAKTKNYLENLTDFAIAYFEDLLKKYGKGRERKTEIQTFDTINATVVAANNEKLYANLKEGFVGYGLKKEEFIEDCSDIDDIIAFRKDGKYMLSKVSEKAFMGKDLLHVAVFRKNDERKVYNVVYYEGGSKACMVKRFNVTSLIRDKEYDLTTGKPKSKILYFTANPNSEAEIIRVQLSALANARKTSFAYDFSELAVKGRNSKGNILTKHPVKKIDLKEKGKSTFGGLKIYFEPEVGKINLDERGDYLGLFNTDDLILHLKLNGTYELKNQDLINKFNKEDTYSVQFFSPETPINCVYFDGKSKTYYVKRFLIETTTIDKGFDFIADHPKSKLIVASTSPSTEIEVVTKNKNGEKSSENIKLEEFIEVKGWKTVGNKLGGSEITKIKLLSPKNIDPEIVANKSNDEIEKDSKNQPKLF